MDIRYIHIYESKIVDNSSFNHICGNIWNGIITWNVENHKIKSIPYDVESIYEKFRNGCISDIQEKEEIDLDEFWMDEIEFLSTYFEKQSLKTKIKITDEILLTIMNHSLSINRC